MKIRTLSAPRRRWNGPSAPSCPSVRGVFSVGQAGGGPTWSLLRGTGTVFWGAENAPAPETPTPAQPTECPLPCSRLTSPLLTCAQCGAALRRSTARVRRRHSPWVRPSPQSPPELAKRLNHQGPWAFGCRRFFRAAPVQGLSRCSRPTRSSLSGSRTSRASGTAARASSGPMPGTAQSVGPPRGGAHGASRRTPASCRRLM